MTKVHINWNGEERRAYQIRWDSFFKVLAPHSQAIRTLVEQGYGMQTPLETLRPVPTEMESRRVAAALHQDGKFKSLRSDGFFQSDVDHPILGFEYQSTHNVGMPVRGFMYKEAFDENNSGAVEEHGLDFVVIYSGDDMPTKARRRDHLQIVERTVRYLFIDLDNVDSEWLGGACIYSYILRLARKDATDFSLFVDAADRIAELSDAEERSRLMEALVMASMNKAGFGIKMLELRMDEEIRKNLEEMIPLMEEMRVIDEQRKAAERLAEVGNAPDAIFDMIRQVSPEGVGHLYDMVFEAARTNNWKSLSYGR